MANEETKETTAEDQEALDAVIDGAHENFTEPQCAQIAGGLLGRIEPTEANLREFWDALPETVQGELESRIAEFTKD